MSVPAPFASIAELLERSLSIRHVYGEPVHHGDTTVIPVARVAFAFGGGGGEAPRRSRKNGSMSVRLTRRVRPRRTVPAAVVERG
jgi:uncharacterized spore protein YtfJ